MNWYSFLNQYVKRHHGGSMTALNPGTSVPRSFEHTADVLVTYEGDYSGYFGLNPTSGHNFEDPRWVPSDPDKFWHIVYDVSEHQVADVIAKSQTRHAGYVYVTDGVLPNPYDTIPTYWPGVQANVAGGAITPAPAAALPTGEPMPGTPSNLTVLSSDYTSATLRWTAAANAASYLVYLDGRMVAELPAALATQRHHRRSGSGWKGTTIFHVAAQGRSGQISTPSNGADALTCVSPRRSDNYRHGHSRDPQPRDVLRGIPDPLRLPAGIHPRKRPAHHASLAGTRAPASVRAISSKTRPCWSTPATTAAPNGNGHRSPTRRPRSPDTPTRGPSAPARSSARAADVQMNADGIGPATYVRAGHPDHRNGISPGAAFTAVAVGSIATIETGGADAPDAGERTFDPGRHLRGRRV